VAVKDVFDMSGHATRLGSETQRGARRSSSDATVVAKLRQAGAAFVGKTAMHELALGVTGINRFEGTPQNPLDPLRVPGGSSSGSAVAVAEGTATVALGSDTGGSVRIPAAFCGVVGFKPGRNIRLMGGLFALAPTLDHPGILARNVETIRRTWAVLAEHQPMAETDEGPWEYLLDADATAESDAVVARAIETAARVLRGRVREIRFPFSGQVVDLSSTILLYEAFRVHRERLALCADRLGADVVGRLRIGSRIAESDYREALRARHSIQAAYRRRMAHRTVLLTPTVGILPPLVAEQPGPQTIGQLVRCTRLANLLGVPAISVPLTRIGARHVALQIHGPSDEETLSVASSFELRLNTV